MEKILWAQWYDFTAYLTRKFGVVERRWIDGEVGEVFAIIVGVILLALCIGCVVLFLRKRRRNIVATTDRWEPTKDIGVESWCEVPTDNAIVK